MFHNIEPKLSLKRMSGFLFNHNRDQESVQVIFHTKIKRKNIIYKFLLKENKAITIIDFIAIFKIITAFFKL